jgi:hypothetical protein
MLKRLRIRAADLFPWACVGVAVVAVVTGLWAMRRWASAVEAEGVDDFGPSVQREDEQYKRAIAGGRPEGRPARPGSRAAGGPPEPGEFVGRPGPAGQVDPVGDAGR